jgi:hypothetical protein
VFEFFKSWLDHHIAIKKELASNPCLFGHKYEAIFNTEIGAFSDFEISRCHSFADLQNFLEAGRSRTETYINHTSTRCGKISKQ